VQFVVTPKSSWQHETAEREYVVTLRSPCIPVEHQLSIDGMSKQQLLVSTELLKRSKYFSPVSVSVGAHSYLSVGLSDELDVCWERRPTVPACRINILAPEFYI